MKIKRYFINIFLFLTVITFYSCSNITEEKLTETNLATVFIDFDSFARTVTPTVNLDNLTNIVVTGKQEGENAYKEIIRFSNCENFNSLEVETGIWTFKLSANCGNSRLCSELTKEIIIGNNFLHFDLELSDYGNSTGALNVKLNFPDSANVKVIKAGLYTVDTNQEVSGFGQEVLSVSNASVNYNKDNAPSGSYILKFNFYADENAEVLINTYKELVKIASDCTSTAERTVTDLNEIYNINYVLDGGTFADGISVPACVTRFSEPFTLPDVFQVKKEKFYLDGFYDNPEFEGEKITQIENVRDDLTLYAKWVRGYYITVEELKNMDFSNEVYNEEDDFYIALYGEGYCFNDQATSNSLSTLNFLFSLDLSRLNNLISVYGLESEFKIKKIILPDSMTVISGFCFNRFRNLETVILGRYVTDIGECAYQQCVNLKQVVVPGTLKTIGDSAFSSCFRLTSIEIPNGVTSIGGYAFSSCSSLTNIVLPDTVTNIGRNIFDECSSLSRVKISNSVTSISYSAFSGCSSLECIEIPESVVNIDERAFYDCKNLKKIYYGGTASQWCKINFFVSDYYYCSGNPLVCTEQSIELYLQNQLATEIELDSSVKEIPDYAFIRCSSLVSIEIPDSVTFIGKSAFSNCTSLNITVPSSTIIDSNAFYNCKSVTYK